MMIIAHRGASYFYPENTKSAIFEAIRQGADMIEVDVRKTKDNYLVLFHDKKLKRLTNHKLKIHKTPLSKIKSLKIKNKEEVLTLQEFLDFISGKIKANIEIKVAGIEGQIINEIKHRKMEKDVIISSSIKKVLKKFRTICPEIETALIFRFRKKAIKDAVKIGVDAVHPVNHIVNLKLVKLAKKYGLKVRPFAINTKGRMNHLIKLGVDGIITDKPILLKKILEKNGYYQGNREDAGKWGWL